MSKKKNEGEFFKGLLEEASRILAKESSKSKNDFLEDFLNNDHVKEWIELFKEFDDSEDKEKVMNKIYAKNFRSSYREFRCNIPLIKGDYMDFVSEIEELIIKSLDKNKEFTLKLLFGFKDNAMAIFENNPKLPSYVITQALKGNELEVYIKKEAEKIKDRSILEQRVILKKKIREPNNEVIQNLIKFERRILENPNALKINVNALINNIEGYYESFRKVSGLLIGLFDILENCFDVDMNRAYYGDCFNTDYGLYRKRKICSKQPGKKVRKYPSLKGYLNKYQQEDISSFYEYLIKSIKPIRITGAHYSFLIEQNKKDLKEGIVKIKVGRKEENHRIEYLMEVQRLLYSYLTLIILIVASFIFENL